MNKLRISIAVLLGLTILDGCTTKTPRAPVTDRLPVSQSTSPATAKPKEPDWRPAIYTIRKGDTLYSIALEHGHDYKEVAEWNGLKAPYTIRIGQALRLASSFEETTTPLKPQTNAEAKILPPAESAFKTEPKATKQIYSDHAWAQLEKPEVKPAPVVPSRPDSVAKIEPPKSAPVPESSKPSGSADDEDSIDWGWPTNGKILANFNDNGNSKGVDISGLPGQPVNASAAGKVVHTGSTLRGYGKLIIIKHNKNFFSVYAHNNLLLVREGQTVVKGQKIAEMGNSDAERVKLHFEIRHLGKPVDPLKYLPSDKPS